MGEGMELRWAELPVEVWQQVFQRVPLLDLVTSGRRVCQQWNQIIQDEGVCHFWGMGINFERGVIDKIKS